METITKKTKPVKKKKKLTKKEKEQKSRNKKIMVILAISVITVLLIILGLTLHSGLFLLLAMTISIIFIGFCLKRTNKVGWKGLSGIFIGGMLIITFGSGALNRLGYELNSTGMFGQGEVQAKVAGFAYGEDTASWTDTIKRATEFTYINGMVSKDVTTSYSATPDKNVGTFNYIDLKSFSWNIDPKGTTSYYPNMLGTAMLPYASDVNGNELDKYEVTNRTTVFTDSEGEEFNIELYSTFVTVQFELEARADAYLPLWQDSGDQWVAPDSMAEVNGWFVISGYNKQYLGSYAADFEYVFELSSSTFTYEDMTHGFEPTFTKNAIIGARIEGYQLISKSRDESMSVESQALYNPLDQWKNKPVFYYTEGQQPIEMYQTCEDAFKEDDSIERTDLNTIDMDDIWDDTVYIKLPFYARMGYHVEDMIVKSGSKYETQLYTYSAKVLYDITFEVINGYGAPINPEADEKDLFIEAKKEGTELNAWAMVMSWYNKLWVKIIIWALVIGIVLFILTKIPGVGALIAIPLKFVGRGIKRGTQAIGTAAQTKAEQIGVKMEKRQKEKERSRKK